jgi:hypothetical protein
VGLPMQCLVETRANPPHFSLFRLWGIFLNFDLGLLDSALSLVCSNFTTSFATSSNRDYVMTDGHHILKVLNIKGNFT